jgi:hypothetical protein
VKKHMRIAEFIRERTGGIASVWSDEWHLRAEFRAGKMGVDLMIEFSPKGMEIGINWAAYGTVSAADAQTMALLLGNASLTAQLISQVDWKEA